MASDAVDEGLLRGAAETVKPILRRMIEQGVAYPVFEERLRELVVRIAEEEFGMPGRRQTLSRLSLLTGLNRKQVRRIQEARDGAEERRAPTVFSRSLATTVISRWMNDPDATDRRGRPLPIPYQRDDEGPSFARFAREATGDLAPRAILDELVRKGVAEVRPDGFVTVATDSYVPRSVEEKLPMLAEDPPELIETMLHNIFGKDNVWLQRKVFQDNVGAEGIERVRKELRKQGERFLRRIVRLLASYDQDRNRKAPKGDPTYVSLGLYYFEQEGVHDRPVRERSSPKKLGSRKGSRKEKAS